ncbi:hypothetical protein NDR87_31650 [Nocardia sp. CDC159]|uniref:DUF2493 domain-containing protein n=1 Tax=Nocardia pulmonis TaxID=2951408 RepID=A0A9X2J0J9_9NOCA|nr:MULTISPECIES: hypothetical protein [Nocardia]MCM6777894.1 hypothetical protein [Nocardia pulmonis]MCM6790935.1 hypothetical protein [Nocardia sp. CDC159]
MSLYRVVIFTGTRRNSAALRDVVVRELRHERGLARAARVGLFVAVGNCPTGVDGDVRAWCAVNLPRSDWHVYEADWARHGKAAGPIRNRDMCRAHPDAAAIVGFPASWDREQSRGTWDCLDAADEMGLPKRIIGPEVWQ